MDYISISFPTALINELWFGFKGGKWLKLHHEKLFLNLCVTHLSFNVKHLCWHHLQLFTNHYWQGFNIIPAWIWNHMPSEVWGVIYSLFPNFNVCTDEVGKGYIIHPTLYNWCNHLPMLGFVLKRVIKRDPRRFRGQSIVCIYFILINIWLPMTDVPDCRCFCYVGDLLKWNVHLFVPDTQAHSRT